jgi:hypothetical protein
MQGYEFECDSDGEQSSQNELLKNVRLALLTGDTNRIQDAINLGFDINCTFKGKISRSVEKLATLIVKISPLNKIIPMLKSCLRHQYSQSTVDVLAAIKIANVEVVEFLIAHEWLKDEDSFCKALKWSADTYREFVSKNDIQILEIFCKTAIDKKFDFDKLFLALDDIGIGTLRTPLRISDRLFKLMYPNIYRILTLRDNVESLNKKSNSSQHSNNNINDSNTQNFDEAELNSDHLIKLREFFEEGKKNKIFLNYFELDVKNQFRFSLNLSHTSCFNIQKKIDVYAKKMITIETNNSKVINSFILNVNIYQSDEMIGDLKEIFSTELSVVKKRESQQINSNQTTANHSSTVTASSTNTVTIPDLSSHSTKADSYKQYDSYKKKWALTNFLTNIQCIEKAEKTSLKLLKHERTDKEKDFVNNNAQQEKNEKSVEEIYIFIPASNKNNKNERQEAREVFANKADPVVSTSPRRFNPASNQCFFISNSSKVFYSIHDTPLDNKPFITDRIILQDALDKMKFYLIILENIFKSDNIIDFKHSCSAPHYKKIIDCMCQIGFTYSNSPELQSYLKSNPSLKYYHEILCTLQDLPHKKEHTVRYWNSIGSEKNVMDIRNRLDGLLFHMENGLHLCSINGDPSYNNGWYANGKFLTS